jgi:hypothetical protein
MAMRPTLRVPEPPCALDEGIEALRYWSERRARLPWYRRGARREAERMAEAWEARVRAAVLRDRFASPWARIGAVRLILGARAGAARRRWARRGTAAAAATVAVAGGGFVALDALVRAAV